VSLQLGAIDLILREQRRLPFSGRALTLGRQHIDVSYEAMLKVFALHEISPRPHIPVPAPHSKSDAIDPDLFFRMLGLETTILDLSPEAAADIVADLNYPVEERYHNRFGLVLDGGTLEHVFDVRQGFVNVASLAAAGGRIMHLNPVNNHVNHGFVQFSPTLFFDYYESNGFADLSAAMIMYSREKMGYEPWSTFEYDPVTLRGLNSMFCSADTMLSIFFKATKTERSTVHVRPIQSFFRQSLEEQRKPTPAFHLEYNKPGASLVQQIH
jgi:hypothetical protein